MGLAALPACPASPAGDPGQYSHAIRQGRITVRAAGIVRGGRLPAGSDPACPHQRLAFRSGGQRDKPRPPVEQMPPLRIASAPVLIACPVSSPPRGGQRGPRPRRRAAAAGLRFCRSAVEHNAAACQSRCTGPACCRGHTSLRVALAVTALGMRAGNYRGRVRRRGRRVVGSFPTVPTEAGCSCNGAAPSRTVTRPPSRS
jgi:hypothetical protein